MGSATGSSTEFNSLLAASRSAQLTCMGLHVLQEIVIKLELDSTSSTGVRLCLGEISSEELHRVCREAAQVHTSVCTAVGRALPPGLGLGTSSCCTSWPGDRQSTKGSTCCPDVCGHLRDLHKGFFGRLPTGQGLLAQAAAACLECIPAIFVPVTKAWWIYLPSSSVTFQCLLPFLSETRSTGL